MSKTTTAIKPIARPAASVEAERLLVALNKQRALEATARSEVSALALARATLLADAETPEEIEAVDRAELRADRAVERAVIISARIAEEYRQASERAEADKIAAIRARGEAVAAEYEGLVRGPYAAGAASIVATLARMQELAAEAAQINSQLPGGYIDVERFRYASEEYWGPTHDTTVVADYVRIEKNRAGEDVEIRIGPCHNAAAPTPDGASIRYRRVTTPRPPVQRHNPTPLQHVVNLPGVTQDSPAFVVGGAW